MMKTMMAVAAFALAIEAYSQSTATTQNPPLPPTPKDTKGTLPFDFDLREPVEGADYPFFSGRPLMLYVKPVGTGWHVEIERGIEGYSFFPLTAERSFCPSPTPCRSWDRDHQTR
jgi:hypothetical protein